MSLSRGGAVAARRAHNPKAVGSNPTPATNQLTETTPSGLFYFQRSIGKKIPKLLVRVSLISYIIQD